MAGTSALFIFVYQQFYEVGQQHLGLILLRFLLRLAINHILGFVWGLVSAAVVLSIILAVLNYQTFFDFESFFASSIIIERIIEPLFPGIVGVIADVV